MKITNKLKVALKSLLSLKMGEIKSGEATLVFDGEAYEVGTEVFVLDENGEAVAAPDGEYPVEGETVVVKDGVIVEIKKDEEPKEETVEAEEEVAPADAAEEPTASVEDRVAALEANMAQIVEGLNAIVNSISEMEARLAEVEGKLAKVEEPAAEPIEEPKAQTESAVAQSKISFLRKK